MFPLQRTTRVKATFGLNVGGVSILRSLENAKVNAFTANGNLRQEVASGRNVVNTGESARVVAVSPALILGVDCAGGFAQVLNAVVQPIPVYVVDMGAGEFPGVPKPNKAMSVDLARANLDPVVSLVIDCKRGLADKIRAHRGLNARPRIGFGVVVQQFAQALRRKIVGSHDAVLSLIGQRPGGVDSTDPGFAIFAGM